MAQQQFKFILLLVLSSTVFLSVLDIFIVNVALPSIQKGLLASDADLQFVIAAYVIAYAIFLIYGSKAGDKFGRKKVLILAMLGFTIASFLCGIVQSPLQLNLSRALQGICAAFMVPQGLTLIQTIFSGKEERTKALGIYGSIAGIASVAGQFLGGLLPVVHMDIVPFGVIDGWRLIFLINIPIGFFSALAAFKYLPADQPSGTERFDYRGLFLLTVFLLSLLFPLIQGRELGWPLWSILLLLLSVPVFCMLLFQQNSRLKKNAATLLNLDLFRDHYFKSGIIVSFFYFIAQDSYFLITGMLMQDGFHISSAYVGLLFVLQGIGYVVGSILSARLIVIYGDKVIMAAVLLMIFSLIGHLICLRAHQPAYGIYLLLFSYGMGCGSVLPSLMSFSLKTIPVSFAGNASGVYSTAQQTAIAVGVALTGGLFFYRLDKGLALPDFVVAYRWATYLNMLALVIVFVLLWSVSFQKKKGRKT